MPLSIVRFGAHRHWWSESSRAGQDYSIKTTPKVIGLIVSGLGFRDRVRDRVINRD